MFEVHPIVYNIIAVHCILRGESIYALNISMPLTLQMEIQWDAMDK